LDPVGLFVVVNMLSISTNIFTPGFPKINCLAMQKNAAQQHCTVEHMSKSKIQASDLKDQLATAPE